MDFPYTHRGCAYLDIHNQLHIEAEPLEQITFPRQRFATAVIIGIFVYGNSPVQGAPVEPD
eukprot:532035-Lingulodinium_polyedra.AAC.1